MLSEVVKQARKPASKQASWILMAKMISDIEDDTDAFKSCKRYVEFRAPFRVRCHVKLLTLKGFTA